MRKRRTERHAAELGLVDLDGTERLGVDVGVRRGATMLIGVTRRWAEADTFDGSPAELCRSLIVRRSVVDRVAEAAR